jgi:hypothetical protein
MKIWIERDGEDGIYAHIKEPEPVPRETFWRSNSVSITLHGNIAEAFRKRLKKDTVAEFELSCIWERVKT